MAKKDSGKVEIHGKEYLTVAYRVKEFRKDYPEYTIATQLVERTDEFVVVKATIKDDQGRVLATGHGEEYRSASQINKTSALENAETSAVGRALAMYKYTGSELASADEVANAIHQQSTPKQDRYITQKQAELLINKVKWGLKEYDPDEIVGFLDKAVGQDFTKLKMSQMDSAIEQVDMAVREDKRHQLIAKKTPEQEEAEEKELADVLAKASKNAEEIDLAKIPF